MHTLATQDLQPHEPPSGRRRRTDNERRGALVRAAFDLIAERGFEGLRTRDVAARAGVNVATLHYYFATKEALIVALRDYLGEQFMVLHAPPIPTEAPPLAQLRQEFADMRYYQTQYPELLMVQLELVLRLRRDPTIRPLLADLQHQWTSSFERAVQDGITHGIFRPDLDPADAAATITAALQGTVIQQVIHPDAAHFDHVCQQIERWLLLTPDASGDPLAPKGPRP